MLEPVQNCFTFYHPDGISSAHDYTLTQGCSDSNELSEHVENSTNTTTNIIQQDLALPTSEIINNS